MRWRLLTVSVMRSALPFSKTWTPPCTKGLRMFCVCPANSAARRNSSWKSLEATLLLGGRSSVVPSMKVGDSFLTWLRATTLRNFSPSGAMPIWLSARTVSMAWTASALVTGWLMTRLQVACGRAAGRSTVRPVMRSSSSSTLSREASGSLTRIVSDLAGAGGGVAGDWAERLAVAQSRMAASQERRGLMLDKWKRKGLAGNAEDGGKRRSL